MYQLLLKGSWQRTLWLIYKLNIIAGRYSQYQVRYHTGTATPAIGAGSERKKGGGGTSGEQLVNLPAQLVEPADIATKVRQPGSLHRNTTPVPAPLDCTLGRIPHNNMGHVRQRATWACKPTYQGKQGRKTWGLSSRGEKGAIVSSTAAGA